MQYVAFRWAGQRGASAHVHISLPSDYETALNFSDHRGMASGVDAVEQTADGWKMVPNVTGPVIDVEFKETANA